MFKDSFFTTFNNYSVTLSKCCDISINDKHVVYFARAMCEINNNDVGRYLVFTGMIQRLHCDWIQWTERRNNKIGTKLLWFGYNIFPSKQQGKALVTNSIKILFFQLHPFRAVSGGIIVARFVQPMSRGNVTIWRFRCFYPRRLVASKKSRTNI